MFGVYGSELRQRPPPPHPLPPYQQATSLPLPPPPPPPPLYQQQGPAPAPHQFFQQGSVPPPTYQNPPSLAQAPFQQPLSLPPPPPPARPLPPPPPPPPALGVQPGQPQPISHPYQYSHERPTLQQTVQQPSVGNLGRPYLPPPPPPPPTYGSSIPPPVNQPQAPGGPSNPVSTSNQNMHQVPQYQHPSHGFRPPSFQPTHGQGLPVPGIQHFSIPPHPASNIVSQAPASFTAFMQGTSSDSHPPSSPPPPPPPLPSSPPPLPSSPPPDVEMQPVDTFVDIISEDGHVDAAFPSTSDASHGEAGHSGKVLTASTGEETCTLLELSEDVTPNGSPPVQNDQSLQNNVDGSTKLDDSDMDMEDDVNFSEPDIELKHGEFDNRFQESCAKDSKLAEENGKMSTSSRDGSHLTQYQVNHLPPTVEADELRVEVKASESVNCAIVEIDPMRSQSAKQENKNAFVHRTLFNNGSPLRQIQDYASDENTDDENSISDVTPTRTAVETETFTPVLKDDLSQMHFPNDEVNIDSETEPQSLNGPTATNMSLVSAETLPSEVIFLQPVDVKSSNEVGSTTLREAGETDACISHEQEGNASDSETRIVDAVNTSPKDENLENAVDTSSLLEDKKQDPLVQKVDEFGRMIREGVSESDSESGDTRYNERYAKRGGSRSSLEVRQRKSHSPWHKTDRRSRSPSWSPRRERSRSPTSSRRGGESARHGRGQPPQCFNFLRGRCHHGSSCRYLHGDFIQNKAKPIPHRDFSNSTAKYETQKGMENVSQEAMTGQKYHSSPDMHEHDRQVRKDNNHDKKQLVHTADGDDKGLMSCPVAPSPGPVEVDDHTFHEIATVEPREEQETHHSLKGSDQKSVEQQPSPPRKTLDQETPSLIEVSGNQLGDQIILQYSQVTNVSESLPLPDKKPDTASVLPVEGSILSSFSETTVHQLSIPSDANSSYPPKPSGLSGQQFQPSQVQFPPSIGAPPTHILSSSASANFFPPAQNPSLPNQFHPADAAPRPSWTEVQPTIPVTGNYSFQFQSNAMPPRNEFHFQSNLRPVHSYLDGVPTMRNYEINQSSHPSVAAHQFFPRPAGNYQGGPLDVVHRENHTSFQQNALSLPMPSHVNMMQGHFRVPPGDNFQKNSLIFPNESGTSGPPGGEFRPLSNSASQPQRLMHGFHSSISSMSSIHGMPSTLEPPFSNQSVGFPEYKQELLPSGVGVPKVASTSYYNPYASTFEQTHREPRFSASFVQNRDSLNERGQWAASSSASRSGTFFANLPGTTASTSYEGISYQGHVQGQSAAPTSGALKHVSDVTTGKQYDPLSDSFDTLGTVLRKLDKPQEKSVVADTSMGLENNILKNSGKLLENSQHKVAKRSDNNFDDEVGETATDTEAGAVENGSPLLDEDGKDWNLEVPVGNTGPVATEIEQQPSPGKSKKGKDSRSMKLFKIAIANFVKEILKPSWRQGNMSKEAFKTIVKKTVDKVAGAMPNHQVPKSQAKIDQYVESSQRKLTKLVMGYVEKYVKT